MNTTLDTDRRTARVAARLHHIVDEAEQLIDTVAASGDEKITAARSKLTEQLQAMRQQLAQMEETAVGRAREAARTTDEAVHRHPYGAMGLAAAAGVLLGLLASRR